MTNIFCVKSKTLYKLSLVGLWQLKYFWNFHPGSLGFHDPIWLPHIFQMGWFNHQLGHFTVFWLSKSIVITSFQENLWHRCLHLKPQKPRIVKISKFYSKCPGTQKKNIPPWSLTARPWKVTFPKKKTISQPTFFRGKLLNFQRVHAKDWALGFLVTWSHERKPVLDRCDFFISRLSYPWGSKPAINGLEPKRPLHPHSLT